MTKFKITVRINDSTTEITIDAIQPIQEILMPDLLSLHSDGAPVRMIRATGQIIVLRLRSVELRRRSAHGCRPSQGRG